MSCSHCFLIEMRGFVGSGAVLVELCELEAKNWQAAGLAVGQQSNMLDNTHFTSAFYKPALLFHNAFCYVVQSFILKTCPGVVTDMFTEQLMLQNCFRR